MHEIELVIVSALLDRMRADSAKSLFGAGPAA